MKKSLPKNQSEQRVQILAECEELRQRCNQMSDKERRAARDRALAIIYGSDATKPTRRR